MLASNILLSGSNYSKVALLFKFMNIGMVDRNTYRTIQDTCCVDTIKEVWNNKKSRNSTPSTRQRCSDRRWGATFEFVVVVFSKIVNMLICKSKVQWKLIWSSRWTNGQPWALCPILHIHCNGKQVPGNHLHHHYRQKGNAEKKISHHGERGVHPNCRHASDWAEVHRSLYTCPCSDLCPHE